MTDWDSFVVHTLGKESAEYIRRQAELYRAATIEPRKDVSHFARWYGRGSSPELSLKSWDGRDLYFYSGRGFGKNYWMTQEVLRRQEQEREVQRFVDAQAPASAAERKWAGHKVGMKVLTREERRRYLDVNWAAEFGVSALARGTFDHKLLEQIMAPARESLKGLKLTSITEDDKNNSIFTWEETVPDHYLSNIDGYSAYRIEQEIKNRVENGS